jgi:hypothetical protein
LRQQVIGGRGRMEEHNPNSEVRFEAGSQLSILGSVGRLMRTYEVDLTGNKKGRRCGKI